jgi:hypothetical protein
MGNAKFDCGVAEDCVLLGYDGAPLGHRVLTLRGNMPPHPFLRVDMYWNRTFRHLNAEHFVC